MQSSSGKGPSPEDRPSRAPSPIDWKNLERPFFSGIAGTGMSALAQYLALEGFRVSGSDRSFDRGQEAGKREALEKLGICLLPQDGEALKIAPGAPSPAPRAPSQASGPTCLIVSTAIEESHPEVRGAREAGLPVFHRSDLLAFLAGRKKTVAVSGTSGKSTVSALVFHVLEAGGLEPSLLSGANLLALKERGLLGNAARGAGDYLVIEADESDGSLVKYHPEIGLLLNVEKDHLEIADLLPIFRTFKAQSAQVILNRDDAHLRDLVAGGEGLFGDGTVGDRRIANLVLGRWESAFTLENIPFRVPVPGRHNVQNALAAIAVGLRLGVSLSACAQGIAAYRGVERRFIRIGEKMRMGEERGITVVDDFAHNPAKVRACLETVRQALRTGEGPGPESIRGPGSGQGGTPGRILAIFHPHGFAPMKLMGRDIMREMAEVLTGADRVYLPEIYYAGGTADKSISSRDLVDFLNDRMEAKAGAAGEAPAVGPAVGQFLPSKEAVIEAVAREARAGDWVVSLGARDPALEDFARRLFAAL